MRLVILKAVGPRHVRVLDVNNPAVGRFGGRDGKLIGTQVGE